MNNAAEPVGTLDVALAHTQHLLNAQPAAAAEQAGEILKAVPGHPVATLLLGTALRLSGDAPAAVGVLETLCREQPRSAAAWHALALAHGDNRQGEAAVLALRNALRLKPDLPDAWRTLADHLTAMGEVEAADAAYAQQIRYSTRDPRLMQAALALCEGRIAPAEALLREHLKEHPTDVAAIRMLAEVAARLGRDADAEALLVRCLELAPGFNAARGNYALVLHRLNKSSQALSVLDRLLAIEPRNPGYRNLQAAIFAKIGEYDRSIALYANVLSEYPQHAKIWMSYGHALKTAGRREECISAYRRSIELNPGLGEAYWSLANLKTFAFSASDVAAMRAQLERAELTDEDRYHFHFAIGKALEDAADYADSFQHYEQGNRLRREGIVYDAHETTSHVQRSKATLTASFFAERSGLGYTASDPIFIVGLPRAGSTLLEQILASHPLVEGTMELPDLLDIARELGGRKTRSQVSRYPEILTTLSADELRALGEQYLARTRIQRKTSAPFFIDKMPNNFAHTGLIHLILPNAKIIDARRHPLGCCFSGFKQHFARGQYFSYGLEDIGRYYHDYVELMAHFDAVLPGRVHRVIYESMIDDTEHQVRALLDYCGLPFDERCLRFHENDRAVRTASSEQVRQPIFREGVDHWRHYEAHLHPLKLALGPVLGSYPAAPEF